MRLQYIEMDGSLQRVSKQKMANNVVKFIAQDPKKFGVHRLVGWKTVLVNWQNRLKSDLELSSWVHAIEDRVRLFAVAEKLVHDFA